MRVGLPLNWGKIDDYVPFHNSYRVKAEYGGIFTCTLGSLTGHQSTGVRQGTVLPVGCGVLFFTHGQSHHGTIICVDPDTKLIRVIIASIWLLRVAELV